MKYFYRNKCGYLIESSIEHFLSILYRRKVNFPFVIGYYSFDRYYFRFLLYFFAFMANRIRFIIFLFVGWFSFQPISSFGLQIKIVESQSFVSSDSMDLRWLQIVNAMGHTGSIVPQTTLDNSSFFASTDVLIISSGSINLPANRLNTISQFLQIGKPVYLQGEYFCNASTNQGFAALVNNLGGSFTWGNTTNGILTLNILGSFSNTNQSTTILNGFNFGCQGTGCGIQYFLELNAKFYGYFFCPSNPSYGSLIHVTDQDWINFSNNNLLMQNIITHLTTGSLCSPSTFTPLNLGSDTTLCNGQSLVLQATNPNSNYLWQDGATTPTYTVQQAGSYWVQVSNSCGVFRDTIQVNYAPAPNVNLGSDTLVCAGQSITLQAFNTGATYLWQDGTTNAFYSPTVGGIYWVQVSIGGCKISDTVIVNFIPSPVVQLGNDTILCEGSSLFLNASTTGATNYIWNTGSQSNTLLVTQSGLYSVTVNTTCGNVTDQININFRAVPQVTLGDDITLCSGNSLTLDATTANVTSYRWNDGLTLPERTISAGGLYWVEISDGFCTDRDSILINQINNLQVFLGDDTILCKGQKLSLDASYANATYLWQDNSIGSMYTIQEPGIYWVKVSVDPCFTADTIQVNYYDQPCTCLLQMPNAFSPNNDRLNDEFKWVSNGGLIELKEMIIYSRWGDIAFQARNVFDGWDGKIKGVDAPIGTYFYYVKYRCSYSNQEYVLKGDVTLIR
jgi:gliding motility-associated-like protein